MGRGDRGIHFRLIMLAPGEQERWWPAWLKPCALQLPPAVSGMFQGSLEAGFTHRSLPVMASPTAPDSGMLPE